MAHSIQTARLRLVPTSADHVRAELEAPARFAALVEAAVPESWPPGEYDADAQRFFLDRLLAEPGNVGGYGWYAIRAADGDAPATVVAGGGYFGPPAFDGTVEIGYSVCPEWRGRGYATELARALVAHALSHPGVTRVIAHTTAGNPASIRVLQQSGFTCVGPGGEPGTLRFECRSPGEAAFPIGRWK